MRNMGFSDFEYSRIVDLYTDSVFKLAMVKTKNKQDAEDVLKSFWNRKKVELDESLPFHDQKLYQ